MLHENLLPLELQFFAEDSAGAEGSAGGDSSGTDGNGNQSPASSTDKGNSGEKTFTQEQLSAVAATEKKQGKQSILNIFGVKTEKEAKEQAEAFKAWQDQQKDAETKLKEQESALGEANAKALAAENKLTCMMAGVTTDSVDDAMAIAMTKVTEDKDLKTVLEEMKKESKYKGFFGQGSSSSSSGTGTPDGHAGSKGSTGGEENMGARLGKMRPKQVSKSNFFTN